MSTCWVLLPFMHWTAGSRRWLHGLFLLFILNERFHIVSIGSMVHKLQVRVYGTDAPMRSQGLLAHVTLIPRLHVRYLNNLALNPALSLDDPLSRDE
jgi:hypothetical protein